MIEPIDSPYLVPFDGSFRVAEAPTDPPKGAPDKKACEKLLKDRIDELDELQRRFWAADSHAMLLVFQAMDAAGKDGTIRAVMSGVNPAGCQVSSFKAPSDEEIDHDFLWRTARRLPERGRIGIFNRSHYEEVLVVRVHPGFLDRQRLPRRPDLETLWQERFESIREWEQHLARNGTVVLKLWLNVSRKEQKKRFLARIEDRERNFKFSFRDVQERQHWSAYMTAYEEALNATSRPWAPWYAIPADEKPYMRYVVADLLVKTLERVDPRYPTLPEDERQKLEAGRQALEAEDS